MPVVGLASLAGSHLVISASGVRGFSYFGLIASVPSLMPISDFGLSAAVTDAAAKYGPIDHRTHSEFEAATKRLVFVGLLGVILAAIPTLFGLWHVVLNVRASASLNMGTYIILAEFLLALPLGVGQRLLLGLNRQGLATLLQSLGTVISVLSMYFYYLSGGTDFIVYGVVFSGGPAIGNGLCWLVAKSTLSKTLKSSSLQTRAITEDLKRVALPMAIISIVLPLVFQSDRLLISWLTTRSELDDYSVACVLFFPLLSLSQVSGQTLWPIFLKSKVTGGDIKNDYSTSLYLFGVLGLIIGCGYGAVGPWAMAIVSGQRTHSHSLFIMFAVFLVVFTVATPAGMFLMDERGRMWQAKESVAALILKVALTCFLTPTYGAFGAILATLLALTVCLYLPNWIAVKRRLSPGSQQ